MESLKVKDELNFNLNNEDISEKINGIRIYNGNKFNAIDEVLAGDVFGVIGIENLKSGHVNWNIDDNFKYEMIPTLKAKVIYDENLNI